MEDLDLLDLVIILYFVCQLFLISFYLLILYYKNVRLCFYVIEELSQFDINSLNLDQTYFKVVFLIKSLSDTTPTITHHPLSLPTHPHPQQTSRMPHQPPHLLPSCLLIQLPQKIFHPTHLPIPPQACVPICASGGRGGC